MDQEAPVVPLPLGQRLSARQWVTVDVVVATLLAAGAIAGIATGAEATVRHDSAWNVLRYVLAVAACAALPYRRLYPKQVLAIIASAVTGLVVVGSRGPLMLAVILAIYTVASLSPPRVSLRAAVVVITGVTVASLAVTGAPGIVAPLPILVGWLAGENNRTRRAYIAGVTAWAAERDRQREERSRQAVADERLRIARELHDVVAHAMSVVAVRSGVARMVVDTQPEEAREALGIIETTSRRALHEMRLLVGVLRDGEGGREVAPAPGLADLPQLVEEMSAAGVAVEVHTEGAPRLLPPGVDVSAYRIVQEALTNVVRHAGPAAARVELRYEPDEVAIEVTDTGGRRARPARYPPYPIPEAGPPGVSALAAAASAVALAAGARGALGTPAVSAPFPHGPQPIGPAPNGPPSGHGLVGMRERVALFGGTFSAGATPAGFRVAAVLPTDDRAPARP